MNRQDIGIITLSKNHLNNVINQLKSLLPADIGYRGYAFEDGLNQMIEEPLVLICHSYLKDLTEAYISDKSQVIVANRFLNLCKIEEILNIPPREKVLFVDVNKSLAESSINFLINLGIDHIKFIPFYPGADHFHGSNYAITTGESRFVPAYIDNIIDIGYSKIDITTITEIMVKLDLKSQPTKSLFSNYVQDLIKSNKKLVKALNHNNYISSQLNTILNVMSDGIIGIDSNRRLLFSNDRAKDIFKVSKAEDIDLKVFERLDIDKFYRSTLTKYSKTHNIGGRDFLITIAPMVKADKNKGFVLTFKNISEIMEMESTVRSDLKNKGHVAKYSFDDIIGCNQELNKCKKIAKKLASSDSTLLITGETGTGKELFAQSIHRESPRRNGPFVAVNFAALHEDLLESELFGYEEGSFTGSRKGGHTGLFEQAHKGTIFLDEIGDASPKIQSRLLRVLQEKEVLKIGATKIIPIDVRVIAATNKNLSQLVAEGNFREDLYYRIKVLPIHIPPIRERKEDIFPLIDSFLDDFPSLNKPIFTEDLRDILYNYDWPGNVREIKNVVEYLCNICEDPYASSQDLPTYLIKKYKQDIDKDQLISLDNIEKDIPYREIYLILNALHKEKSQGNLYVSRKVLSERLKDSNLSEQMIRTRLDTLDEYKVIVKGRGSRGSRITELGESFLEKLSIEYQ